MVIIFMFILQRPSRRKRGRLESIVGSLWFNYFLQKAGRDGIHAQSVSPRTLPAAVSSNSPTQRSCKSRLGVGASMAIYFSMPGSLQASANSWNNPDALASSGKLAPVNPNPAGVSKLVSILVSVADQKIPKPILHSQLRNEASCRICATFQLKSSSKSTA